jgi:NAD+ synthetase
MQNKITKKGPLLDENGHLKESGYATQLIKDYDRKAIKAKKSRIKEWDYYLIYNKDYAVALTVDDNSYMGLNSITLIDFNKKEETKAATLVGKAFCTDFQTVHIGDWCKELSSDFSLVEGEMTPIAKGNIQARFRMMYLYNLASIHKGIVMDTDNLTENNLGYWTLHGDVGDFNPIGGLWKTEIFKLAEYLDYYYLNNHRQKHAEALEASCKLKPTAGLGITDCDLEELGAQSYQQVDAILQEILAWKWLSNKRGDFPESIKEQREMFLDEQQMLCYPIEVILNITNRHFSSEFKRKKLPIKIERDSLLV